MKDRNDHGPETQPVRKWPARLRAWCRRQSLLLPRQHDREERDHQGRRW